MLDVAHNILYRNECDGTLLRGMFELQRTAPRSFQQKSF